MNGRILFLVPARGGSRRVAGKNLRRIGGIPLVGRAVRTGLAAAAGIGGGDHAIVCSTDDPAIAAAAQAWGAQVLDRPADLAGDKTPSADVALHALETVEAGGGAFETLVLLQPTSPLVEPSDVTGAVHLHRESGGRAVASVAASHPAAWHRVRLADGALEAAPGTGHDLLLTGGVYVVAAGELRATGRLAGGGPALGFEVPRERAIDVDEEVDLLVAEALLAARPVGQLEIDGRTIGGGRTFVIAEGGVNHNGEADLAMRLVDAAADAGADAVKFQTFDPDALASQGAPTARYQRENDADIRDQRDLLARLVLPREAWARLRDRARDRGLVFLSTPFDDGSADLLHALGVPAFKVGSGELTNTPFITRLARRGRPMLVSTGMADLVEVAAAVDAVRAGGDVPLALFHCVSSYPASPRDANLRAMETMRRAFGVPVGWSDHTGGIELALAAVAAGASLIEKHVTLDRGLPGPDHAASLEPAELAAMVRGIRAVEASLGSGIKEPVPAERDVASVARRSLHWAADLPAASVVRPTDLAVLRPGTGMAPARLDSLVGGRTTRGVRAGARVEPGDVEPGA